MQEKKFLAALLVMVVVITGVFAVAIPGHVDKSFAIVHTNDTHCHYDDEGSAGFTTVASLRDGLSAEMPVFTVDAGDFLSGNAYGTITEGRSSVTIMNAVGYDLSIPGNHEFDFGLDVFLERAQQLNFPVICSNLVYKDTGKPVFDEYLVLERGGVRVGFFGLLTNETEVAAKQGHMGNTQTTDQVEAAQRMVSLLRTKDVDSIVAVGHLGVEKEGYQTSDLVCQRVPGIDIFIDGHSHTEMEDGKVCDGSIVLLPHEGTIASTGYHTKNVGIVKSLPDGISAKLYRGPAIHDARVDRTISDVIDDIDKRLEEVIGTTEVYLHGETKLIRTRETNLGDLVADSMVHSSGQQIAIVNSGAIRTWISPGDITLHQTYNVLPFTNYTVTLDVPGSVILQEMEFSLRNAGGGSFLQISGMTVTYDPEGEPGRKVTSIEVAGEPIGMDTVYSLVTVDYIYTGGDGNTYLKEYSAEVGDMLDVQLIGYIRDLGTITESSIHTGRLIPA